MSSFTTSVSPSVKQMMAVSSIIGTCPILTDGNSLNIPKIVVPLSKNFAPLVLTKIGGLCPELTYFNKRVLRLYLPKNKVINFSPLVLINTPLFSSCIYSSIVTGFLFVSSRICAWKLAINIAAAIPFPEISAIQKNISSSLNLIKS